MKSRIQGLIAAALLVGPMAAQASLIVQVTDGTTTLSVADGGAGDLSGDTGIINWSGAFGGYNVVLSLAAGTADPMAMHLTAAVVGSGGSGPVSILFTQTDLAATGPMSFAVSGGGAGSGLASWATYADDSNAAFGTSTLLVGNSGYGTASGTLGVSLDGLYSATIATMFDYSGLTGFTGSSLDVSATAVPEPGSLALLGLGLAGLGLARRRSVTA